MSSRAIIYVTINVYYHVWLALFAYASHYLSHMVYLRRQRAIIYYCHCLRMLHCYRRTLFQQVACFIMPVIFAIHGECTPSSSLLRQLFVATLLPWSRLSREFQHTRYYHTYGLALLPRHCRYGWSALRATVSAHGCLHAI